MVTALCIDSDAARRATGRAILLAAILIWPCVAGAIEFKPAQLVTAGGSPIDVAGYSVPSMADWNNDGLADLIVGEGSGTYTPGVRVYLNNGTTTSPAFTTFTYAQSMVGDATFNVSTPGSGCLGMFPRITQWDGDGNKDLLVGEAGGTVRLFTNVGTDEAPVFDLGTPLMVGPADGKTIFNPGARATPSVVDWNNDGLQDVICGSIDGRISLLINEGTNDEPDFGSIAYVQASGLDLDVSAGRSSPAVADLNGDGTKDLIVGDTNGMVHFFANIGTDAEPVFGDDTMLTAGGALIDLPSFARSRLSVCDWTNDGHLDLLIGGGDGMVYLYESVPEPASLALLTVGGLGLLRRRR